MKLWKLTQESNTGYDTYDGAVVAAETEEEARKIDVNGATKGWPDKVIYMFTAWALSWTEVTAVYIGEAAPGTETGIILASFNAG